MIAFHSTGVSFFPVAPAPGEGGFGETSFGSFATVEAPPDLIGATQYF